MGRSEASSQSAWQRACPCVLEQQPMPTPQHIRCVGITGMGIGECSWCGHAARSYYRHAHAPTEPAFGVWSQRWHPCGRSWHCWPHRPAATAYAAKVLTASPAKASCWHAMGFRHVCGRTASNPLAPPPRRTPARGQQTPCVGYARPLQLQRWVHRSSLWSSTR